MIWQEGTEGAEQYHLTEKELEAVHRIKKEKYDTWEWNYGASPAFDVCMDQRFPWERLKSV